LPEDGFVRPQHVAIKCDFNDILKQVRDFERFWASLEREMSERVL
jgi:hypothetical protein